MCMKIREIKQNDNLYWSNMIGNEISLIKINKNVLKLILQLKILNNFESFIYKYSYVSFIVLPSRSCHR